MLCFSDQCIKQAFRDMPKQCLVLAEISAEMQKQERLNFVFFEWSTYSFNLFLKFNIDSCVAHSNSWAKNETRRSAEENGIWIWPFNGGVITCWFHYTGFCPKRFNGSWSHNSATKSNLPSYCPFGLPVYTHPYTLLFLSLACEGATSCNCTSNGM